MIGDASENLYFRAPLQILVKTGKCFRTRIVARIRRDYQMRTRYERLRDAGMLAVDEMADLLGVSIATVKTWRSHSLLRAHAYTDKNECLYEHPGEELPVKAQGQKLSERSSLPNVVPNGTHEVQCEA